MCEAKVYVYEESSGEDREVMQDVTIAEPEGDAWVFVDLFGEQKVVHGKISRIDFLHHAIYLVETAKEKAPAG